MCIPEPSDPPAPDAAARPSIVLVVEDEILIRLALADHLRDSGVTVYEAANGAEAVDLLTHHGGDIDAIFTDIMMPGPIDGLALYSWATEHCPGVPVILTSGVQHQDPIVCHLESAGLFFLKPYNMDRVAALLMKKAKECAQTRDAASAKL
jgi:DNA-binding NtrC family response regulator